MGGEGSIQGMITILRNNKKLLRKRNPFHRGTGFEKLRSDYLKYSKGSIESKPISKEELTEIRRKILRERRKERILSSMILTIVVSIAITFSLWIYGNIKKYEVQQDEIVRTNNTQKYLYYIEDGDMWLEKGKYHNAIFQYTLAKEIYPKEFDVNYRLAMAYGGKCRYERSGCEEGRMILQDLLDRFPDRLELWELESYF